MPRAVAQLGSAPDWGSGGRRFKSCQPDVKALMRSYFHQGFVMSGDEFLLDPSGPLSRVRSRGRRRPNTLRRLWHLVPVDRGTKRGPERSAGLIAGLYRDLGDRLRDGPLALADRARKALACSAADARCRSSGSSSRNSTST